MHDQFKTYRRNHDTGDVKNTEQKKIAKDGRRLAQARRKMDKHKYHDAQEMDEHYEDMLQAEHLARKRAGNIKTRKKRLKNFIENGHIG